MGEVRQVKSTVDIRCVCVYVCVRCCALQADSEQLKQAWLSALQGSIDLAYRTEPQLTQAGSGHRQLRLMILISYCCCCTSEMKERRELKLQRVQL